MVPGQQLVQLLSVLYQLLAEQRRGERGPYVLRCLKEVARCQTLYPDRTQVQKQELVRLWGRVWALALRGVSSPQTEALSLDLLASIVQGGLINMDREFWKLFSGSVCKPSQWASAFSHQTKFKFVLLNMYVHVFLLCSLLRSGALCLAQALLKHPVPKSHISSSSWDHVGVPEGSGSPNMKETLIAWLLMTDQSDEMEDSSRPHPIICRLEFGCVCISVICYCCSSGRCTLVVHKHNLLVSSILIELYCFVLIFVCSSLQRFSSQSNSEHSGLPDPERHQSWPEVSFGYRGSREVREHTGPAQRVSWPPETLVDVKRLCTSLSAPS